MRFKHSAISFAIVSSFVAGIMIAPFVPQAMQAAHAAAVPVAPHVVDVAAMKIDDLPQMANSPLRTAMLFSSADGTVSVQSGIVQKHTHQQSDELQFILEGSGSMWVGNERKEFKPGTLIVIPRGSAHGGASANYKALAIKLPPAVAGDSQHLD